MLLFPGLTQLDLTGPFELLHRVPGATVHLLWKERGTVCADSGLGLVSTTTFADCPGLDLLFVPGGPGQLSLEYDPAPPFDSGHPDVADPALVESVRARFRERSQSA